MHTLTSNHSISTRPGGVFFPLHSFLPHVDELIFLVSREGEAQEVSPSACSLLRCKPDEVRGRPCNPWFLEQESLTEVLEEAADSNTPAYTHLTLLPKGGESVPTVACAQGISAEDGPLILLILKPLEVWDREPQLAAEIQHLEDKLVELQISLGETARKLSEKTVQLAEERNKTLAVISNMTAGVIALDPEGRVTQANHRAEELLGLPEGGLFSRLLVDAAPAIAEALSQAEGTPEAAPAGARLTADGKALQVDSSPIMDPHGNTGGRVVVLHDRTQEEELHRMREELVSIVSHEMRGPLTTIKGYLQVVLRGEAGPLDLELHEILGIVSENAQRLAVLVEDLLDLSALESGRIALERRPVNITALVYCTYCDLQRRTDEKGICLQTDVPDDGLRVFGDERRLLQVLSNLGSNAVKFTPPTGEVTLWARAEGDNVVFGVTDTGMGITEEDRKQIFTKFFRSRETSKRKIPGTGLGLCIVRRIVEAHEGTIECESRPDEGATFRVTLPAFAESADTVG